MGIGTLHTVHAIAVNGSGSYNLDGVETVTVDPGVENLLLRAAGIVDPSFTATISATPTIAATISDIKTLLDGAPLAGMKIPQTTVITGLDFHFTQLAQGGEREGTLSHPKITVNEGMLITGSISWTQGAHATAEVAVHTSYDGTNNPFVYTADQTLPHTPTIAEAFTGGKVMINGSQLTGVTGVNINFNYTIITEASDGEVFPTFVGIGVRDPVIEITTKDVLSLSSYGITGTAQGATDSIVYLTKIDKNGARVANGTAEHISFTVDDGMVWASTAGGANGESNDATVMLQPTWDGTNDIFAIDTATTIT